MLTRAIMDISNRAGWSTANELFELAAGAHLASPTMAWVWYGVLCVRQLPSDETKS
jgi:hypothetical protein